MSNFGEAAARLSGAAAMLLGWRSDDFWNATPAELAAVLGAIAPEADAPVAMTIDELRRCFPDEITIEPTNQDGAPGTRI